MIIKLAAQETLDIVKFSDCEIFKEKKEFDRNERLTFIKENEGQRVTVFFIRGKTNRIKSKYEGEIFLGKQPSKVSLKVQTSVVRVKFTEGDRTVIKYPMTDDKTFRIYRSECLESK